MKKVLLSTSAIALAGAFATSATAADWNVRVGGYYNAMVAYADTDTSTGGISSSHDFSGVDVSTNAEIFFLPSITLDNGIKIGANIQLEGEQSGDQIDESFVQIKGSFGEILIGSENSAGYKMTYAAPNAAIISFNSPSTPDYIAWTGVHGAFGDSVFRGTLGTTFLEVGGNNDAKRITYFTPRFSGFQLGVSYAHDGNQDNWGPTDISSASGNLSHIFDIGANYVQSFGDLNIAVSGRWGTGSQGSYNPTVWSLGANIGYGGFTVGGSFAESNEHNGGVDDGTAFDIGMAYATGPWKFSLTWFHGENGDGSSITDGAGDPVVGPFGPIVISHEEQDTIGGAINYQLAKGVRLNLFAAYVKAEAKGADGEFAYSGDISGWVIGTGIGLSF